MWGSKEREEGLRHQRPERRVPSTSEKARVYLPGRGGTMITKEDKMWVLLILQYSHGGVVGAEANFPGV